MSDRLLAIFLFFWFLVSGVISAAQTQAKCTFSTFSPPSGYYFTSVS